MAKSLKIVDGDFVFDNLGKAVWVDENERKAQSINLRLYTPNGNMFYNDEYGRLKLTGKVTKEAIETHLMETFDLDEEVTKVKVISYEPNPDKKGYYFVNVDFTVTETVYDEDDEEEVNEDVINLDLDINI